MKKLLIALMISTLSLIGIQSSNAVIKVVGGQAACDTTLSGCNPIPLAASLLCDGTVVIPDCPQFFAPDWSDSTGTRFFGITNRINPARCVKSVGGTSWGLCNAGTVSPFTGVLDNFGANFAVASNGALIAAGDQGANNCIIRRSTDGGASWSTVFTDSVTVNVSCGLGFGNPTPNTLRCASNGNYCVMIAFISGTFDLVAYWSTDNGLSWTKGTNFNIASIDAQISVAVGAAGTSGSLSRYGTNYNTPGKKFANTSGGDWTITGLIPTSPGSADGQNLRCVGAVMFTGQGVLCGPDQTATTTYRFFTHSGLSVGLSASVIPQNGLTNGQAPDFMAVGYSGSVAYVIGRNAATTQIVIWVTTDTFGSMIQIGTLTPTTVLLGGTPRGDIYVKNGKIYFTSGASGSNAFFGVIQ